jgi:hypothetical protein
MAVDEMLARVRRTLEETYGVDGAAYLMDRPRGGWDDLVTRDALSASEERLRAEISGLRSEVHDQLRHQTWQLAALVAGAQAVVVVAIAGIGAVLRFA